MYMYNVSCPSLRAWLPTAATLPHPSLYGKTCFQVLFLEFFYAFWFSAGKKNGKFRVLSQPCQMQIMVALVASLQAKHQFATAGFEKFLDLSC